NLVANFTDPDDGAVLTATYGAPPAGGVVSGNSNGTFIYTPVAGSTSAQSFNYTVTDGIAPQLRSVTITPSNMVWYVKNNLAGAGSGRSVDPFNTLASVN